MISSFQQHTPSHFDLFTIYEVDPEFVNLPPITSIAIPVLQKGAVHLPMYNGIPGVVEIEFAESSHVEEFSKRTEGHFAERKIKVVTSGDHPTLCSLKPTHFSTKINNILSHLKYLYTDEVIDALLPRVAARI